MIYEHSAGAVIFRPEQGQALYLILHYEEGHWGCSKGHTENSETVEETARREIHEETGLTDITFIPGFSEKNHYYFMINRQRISKTVTFLLAETCSDTVTISDEHIDFAWLTYPQALERITFINEKKVLQKAQSLVLVYLAD
jgi:bis(5'-nucleosidyl)-tetraphosphatase